MSLLRRSALIWGGVCFLLLYRTFPADIITSWQLTQHYDIPASPLLWGGIIQVVLALLPMACFLWLGSGCMVYGELSVLFIPFLAWLSGQFLIAYGIYVWAVKSDRVLPYEQGFLNIAEKMMSFDWLFNVLVSAIIIVTCSYAFYREVYRAE